MIFAFLYFFLATTMSYLGSLQPGPINMLVVQTAIQKNYKGAFLIGLGGTMAEIIYSSLAFATTDLISKNKNIGLYSSYVLILVFLFLAYNSFRLARNPKAPLKVKPAKGVFFFKGWGIGMLNPQLITYWLIIILYFKNVGWMSEPDSIEKVGFVLGTATGALLLQTTLIALVKRFERFNISQYAPQINYGMAVLFIGLAVHQWLKM